MVAGPQFEIIDGTIVVNQASLVHDRHAAAAAEAGELEEVEENDFTRLTTSSTYLRAGKLRGPNAWTAAETEHFYRALAMLGTDFTMMAAMFPGKTRRHVKLKFNREERANPRRIDAALIGEKKVPIDLAEYASYTGLTYKTTHALQAEFDDREREHHATQKRLADEQADALRRRRELLFGRPRLPSLPPIAMPTAAPSMPIPMPRTTNPTSPAPSQQRRGTQERRSSRRLAGTPSSTRSKKSSTRRACRRAAATAPPARGPAAAAAVAGAAEGDEAAPEEQGQRVAR